MKKKQKEYQELAQAILTRVGGQENVENVIHCVTRLRFYLKDEDQADREALEELLGVMGIVEANNQFQVVVGQAVDDIYAEVEALLPNQTADTEKVEDTTSGFKDQETFAGKLRYGFNQ